MAVGDDAEGRQMTGAVAQGQEIGEVDSAPLDDFDQLFELVQHVDQLAQFGAGQAA